MKIIFENQFICTKDYYKEFYKYNCFKRPIIITINIILSISFLVSILSMIFPKLIVLDANTAKANIATVLIILCLQIYVFFRNKTLAYNRALERNKGNPMEVRLSITEKDIRIFTNSEKDMNIELANIEKAIETKDYYILVSKAKLAIALKKDAFIKGTENEFKEFLRQKRLIKK